MRRRLLALIAAALVGAPAAAQSSAPAGPPTAEESRQLEAIAERGRLLFDLDRAAWVATDDLLAKLPDPASAGFKGYVVEREPGGFVVTFFGGDPGQLTARYVGRVARGRVISGRLLPAAERVPLTPMQARLASVRAAASGFAERPCTPKGFNAAIVPPATLDEPVDMYLTSPQTEAEVIPVGGHYLLRVDKDGRVISTRKFTNSCLNMRIPKAKRGRQPAALVVSHVLDPLPTEIHAFMSMAVTVPLMVVVSEPARLWVVHKGAITFGATREQFEQAGTRRR